MKQIPMIWHLRPAQLSNGCRRCTSYCIAESTRIRCSSVCKVSSWAALGKLYLRVKISSRTMIIIVLLDATIEQSHFSISTGRLGATVVLDNEKIDQGNHYGWRFEEDVAKSKRSNENAKGYHVTQPKNYSIWCYGHRSIRQNDGQIYPNWWWSPMRAGNIWVWYIFAWYFEGRI